MKKGLLSMVLVIAIAFTVGCSRENAEQTLTLSVAASLTDCMTAIQKAYNEEYPNSILRFNFGSSGALQQQIEQGAPTDIFFSAGMKQMKALEEQGLMVEESVEEVLKNQLVLIIPLASEEEITFNHLKDAPIDKIAVGEVESVPVGQYTVEVFDHLGITKALQSKLVYAKDVREVLSWVETRNVDAGVVYKTDAKISDKVKISDQAAENLHTPIIYPIGIVKGTKELEAAQLFISFLKTETARKIFEDYGFTPILKS